MPVIAHKSTVQLRTEEGCITLTYSLVSRPVQAEGFDAGEMTEYGIRVEMSGPGERAETAEIQGITCSESEALQLAARIAAGAVTPVTLADVVDDYLAQW